MLLLHQTPFACDLLTGGLDGGLTQSPIVHTPQEGCFPLLDGLLPGLQFAGCLVHGLLLRQEAITALLVVLGQLLADAGQLLAYPLHFLHLATQFLLAGRQIPLPALDRLLQCCEFGGPVLWSGPVPAAAPAVPVRRLTDFAVSPRPRHPRGVEPGRPFGLQFLDRAYCLLLASRQPTQPVIQVGWQGRHGCLCGCRGGR